MHWPGAAEGLALFVEYLLKTTLALSLCLILVAVFRTRAAAIRHFMLASFLIGMLLLPVVSALRFGWETDLLPALTPETAVPGARDPIGGPERGFSGIHWLFTPATQRSAGVSAAGASALPAPPSPPAPGLLGILGALLPFVWSAGLAFFVLKLSTGILGAYRLACESRSVTDPVWRVLLARLLAAIRIRRTVRLRSHGAIRVPVTWGWIRPVILIPNGHEEWTEDQRSSALLHELCHVKRADLLVMFLVRLSLAVFWFNPLCWVVFRRLRQEQERACDELALTVGIKPSTYAATLLFFKRTVGFRQNISTAFLGLLGSDAFHARVAAILRQKLTFREVTMKTRITLAIAVMLAVSLIGLARPSQTAPEPPLDVNRLFTAAPQPAGLPASVPSYPPGALVQEQKAAVPKEQAEKKDAQKPTIVITDKNGAKIPIEVTIVTGDTSRTIQVAKPFAIKTGKEGELILLGPDGKEVEILKGEPLHLTIEGKDLTVTKAGSQVTVDKADVLRLVTEKDSEGRVRVQVVGPLMIKQIPESGAKKIAIYVPQKGEEGRYLIDTAGQDQTAALQTELKALQEKLAQVKEKQVDVSEMRQAVAKLMTALAELRAQKRAEVKAEEKLKTFAILRPQEKTAIGSKIRIMRDAGKSLTMVMKRDGADFTIVFGVDPGESGRAIYDRVVAKVKLELPQGYAVEPQFNETSGSVTLKITGAGMQKTPADLIKKIVEVIQSEIK